MSQNIKGLLEAKNEVTGEQTASAPIVLMSRIRFARNLSGYPFPGWASEMQRQEIYEMARDAVVKLPAMKGSSSISVEELSELERQVLVERHLVSRELCESEDATGVVISADQSAAIMINEEDHLRIQVLRSGFNFKKVWKVIDEIDTSLEENLDFAFSPELGYLTACPTNVGTGIRASIMMHLPGLVIAKQMEKVVRAVNQLGIVVRGLFGEGSDASGSIFQISNQQTLGESEDAIIKRLSEILNTIVEHENNARERLLENESNKLLDKIGRAFGILQNGHLLSSSEAMNHLSLIRLAVDFGLLSEDYRPLIDRLFIESQPGHIQLAARSEVDSSVRDVQRAAFLRNELRKLPPVNFDNLNLQT
jgi:protein arginine kinase